MEEVKSIFKSKTFWVNFIGLVVMVVPLLSDYELVNAKTAGLVLGVANIVLRYISKGEVNLAGAKKN